MANVEERVAVLNPWVAIVSNADPVRWARALAGAREQVLSGGSAPRILREVVTASWGRSAAAGVDPDRAAAPLALAPDEVDARWEAHPLAAAMDAVRSVLAEAGEEARHLIVVADADGHLLRVEGDPAIRDGAQAMNFVPGANWSEAAAGTNAPGTALALDHPVQIFSAEHFRRVVDPWTCAAAPVHDPDSGAALGVIDLTSGMETAHPHSLMLVTAAARLAEAELRARMVARDERLRAVFVERLAGGGGAGGWAGGGGARGRVRGRGGGGARPVGAISASGRIVAAGPGDWVGGRLEVPAGGGELTLPDGGAGVAEPVAGGGLLVWRLRARGRGGAVAPVAPVAESVESVAGPLVLRVLGEDEPELTLGGAPLHVSPRHAEILTLLALHPEGLSAERLLLELYGDEPVAPVTTRAEISRLRGKLGAALAAKPYRLVVDVDLDLEAVEGLLDGGWLAQALARYPGPLLPASTAPGIVAARDRLEGALRRALFAAADAELLWRWCRLPSAADDVLALRALTAALAPADPRRAWALSTLAAVE